MDLVSIPSSCFQPVRYDDLHFIKGALFLVGQQRSFYFDQSPDKPFQATISPRCQLINIFNFRTKLLVQVSADILQVLYGIIMKAR